MRIVAVYSIKGGVGKTTTAVNLASLAAREGRRVLLWDLDPQGAASYAFRVRPKVRAASRKLVHGRRDLAELVRGSDVRNLDLLPADLSDRHLDVVLSGGAPQRRGLRGVLAPLERDYDLVVLDCAPSVSRVSEAVIATSDVLLVPTTPAPLSLRTLAQLHAHVRALDVGRPCVLAFLTMLDRRRAMHRRYEAWAGNAAVGMLATIIPLASQVEQMSVERRPLDAFAPTSAAGEAYRRLWHELAERLEGPRAGRQAPTREDLDGLLATARPPSRPARGEARGRAPSSTPRGRSDDA